MSGVAPTAWLTDSTGVPAHRVAAQLVKQAAVLEGLSAHVGLVSADIGAICHFERLANPLELDVAPSMVALANMC